MGYIYKVTNTVNGKAYVGQTRRTIEQRWKQHVYNSFNEAPYNKGPFHCAIKKYGVDAFIVEELEECKNEDLDEREMHWIKYLDTLRNGYNATTGGDHPYRWDDEGILPLWNEGLSIKEIAEKIGISKNIVSDRLRIEGISAAETTARAQAKGGETSRLPIYMYDREGNYIKEFPSKQEAAKEIGYNGCLRGGSFCFSTVCGYQFRRYKVDKIDTVVAEHTREVHQYTIEGDYIATYTSLSEAARSIQDRHANGSMIGKACRDESITQAYGYRWSYEKVNKLPPIRPSKKCRPVVRITTDGKERTEYCSAAQAGRENNVSANAIIDACKGIQKHSAGYRWEYANCT